MRIGLLGGSFNPVHNGHLAIALEVLSRLELDRVWFVPAGIPPHKSSEELLPFTLRCKLIKDAIENFPHFELIEKDYRPGKKSYTFDLIEYLRSEFPEVEFNFIIGDDIVPQLMTWYRFSELLEIVKFVVVSRKNRDKSWENLDYIDKLIFLKTDIIEVSSSDIRRKIKNGHNISSMVPQNVWEYFQTGFDDERKINPWRQYDKEF
ncbi:MAG: nicotinate-nucleotide adenylyltransferase [Candidatus Cloacimonetes bacterium]|nr:nicotinate-nucleotide adenylyltransferase [Candidatus Cloacimonadota bacterium]